MAKKTVKKKVVKKVSKKTTTKTASRTAADMKSNKAGKRDVETAGKLSGMAQNIVTAVHSDKGPEMDVPIRAASNTNWNAKKGILEMGDSVGNRQLFNLGQARKFMQTLLHGKSVDELDRKSGV